MAPSTEKRTKSRLTTESVTAIMDTRNSRLELNGRHGGEFYDVTTKNLTRRGLLTRLGKAVSELQ